MKIATWNINGVKARLDGLVGWLRESNPDIACLQEIKSVDETFPRGEIEALGYHVETHGQKGFNGVALLSKVRPDEINRGLPGDPADEQSRFIEGVFSVNGGALRVCCLYLPNGNPVETEKYPYKLAWMRRLAAFAEQRLVLEEPLILAGDYNVIPEAHDCWDVKVWRNDASTCRRHVPPSAAAQPWLHRRGARDLRRGAALFILGLSGRLLAEEFRHPHRSPDAVAGGGRQARVDLYRKARPGLGKAVRPCARNG